MYNETVPVTAADALFLGDKTAETEPIKGYPSRGLPVNFMWPWTHL
jgi:hypothetical protein